MVANSAKYHQSCKLQYIQQHKVVTSREKAPIVDSEDHDVYTTCKCRKSIVSFRKRGMFFLLKACALLLEDTELLTKLNTGRHGGLRSQLSYKVFLEMKKKHYQKYHLQNW